MKIIINESQLRQIIESEKKDRLYPLPANDFVENWEDFINTYKRKNKYDGFELDGDLNIYDLDVKDIERILNEVVIVTGNLDLFNITRIKSLGRLEKVGGKLDLFKTSIKSLKNLVSVGGSLDLTASSIEDLDKLKSVGGSLNLFNTPLGKKLKESGMSEDEIKNKFGVNGNLFL
jgi:hypothetical protein